MVYQYPFRDVRHVVDWVNCNNPARAKSFDISDSESKEFNENTPVTWGVLCRTIWAIVKEFHYHKRQAFMFYALGDMDRRKGITEIADLLEVSPRTIRRYVDEVYREIEDELINIRAIPERQKVLN